MTIVDITTGSSSAWILRTSPYAEEVDVSRVSDMVIEFSKMLDVSSIRSEKFKLIDHDGWEVTNAFRPISSANDYNPITGVLTIRLAVVLDTLSEYTLFIDGLQDAAGENQDAPHTVTFTTNENNAELSPDITSANVLGVIDKSIVDADLVEQQNASGLSAYMNPIDGAYNVASTTETIEVRFYPPDGLDALGTTQAVYRRPVSRFESAWENTGATFVIDAGVVTITLPQVSSGVYVEPGYEYRVDIGLPSTTGESLFEFMFLGELENMLTSVQSVLLQAPGSSSMDIARMIYLNSADAIEYDSGQGTTPTKAGTDYVLYSTLWQIATTTPPSAKITLGDLTVDPGSTSSESRWRKLMEDALAKLSKADPKFLVKGSGNTSPHAARDWDATGTTKRRIGKTS